jgi:putative glutamine amidotransferase
MHVSSPLKRMNPIILIISTSGEDKNKAYIETILEHQGMPILQKEGEDFMGLAPQGILLTGGGDLNDIYYDHSLSNEERSSLGRIEPDREAYELRILEWAAMKDIPTLGICRGFQMLNVFAGGTLIPDIPTWQKRNNIKTKLQHRLGGDYSLPAHPIILDKGSIFSSIFGHEDQLMVNSSHHQAISRCGTSLRITARATDGIIEAFENPGKKFWMGVQFHPERMWRRYPVFSNLFRVFMEHAQRTVL